MRSHRTPRWIRRTYSVVSPWGGDAAGIEARRRSAVRITRVASGQYGPCLVAIRVNIDLAPMSCQVGHRYVELRQLRAGIELTAGYVDQRAVLQQREGMGVGRKSAGVSGS